MKRWKHRLAWGAFAFVGFFVFTVVIGTVTQFQPANQPAHKAEAAVLVSDINNTVQNAKTAISTATTAANTATQVINQVRNLTSMSPDGLLAHYLGLSQELSKIIGAYQAYNGLLNSAQSAEQAWQGTFQNVSSFFDGSTKPAFPTNDLRTLAGLEKTYQDSMNISKQISDTKDSSKALQDAMNRVANAGGAKESAQASAQVSSLAVQEGIKTNSILSTIATTNAAHYQNEIQEKAAAIAANKKSAADFSAAVQAKNDSIKADSRTEAEREGYPSSFSDFLK